MSQPHYDYTFIKLQEQPKQIGSILLPDSVSNKDSMKRGTVVAVGLGLPMDKGGRMPIDVNVGDFVLFTKFAGHDVHIDGEDVLIVRADDIYCVVEP
jgi:chaperonin GroES